MPYKDPSKHREHKRAYNRAYRARIMSDPKLKAAYYERRRPKTVDALARLRELRRNSSRKYRARNRAAIQAKYRANRRKPSYRAHRAEVAKRYYIKLKTECPEIRKARSRKYYLKHRKRLLKWMARHRKLNLEEHRDRWFKRKHKDWWEVAKLLSKVSKQQREKRR